MQKQKEIGRGTVYLGGEWKRRMKRGRRGEKEGEGGVREGVDGKAVAKKGGQGEAKARGRRKRPSGLGN